MTRTRRSRSPARHHPQPGGASPVRPNRLRLRPSPAGPVHRAHFRRPSCAAGARPPLSYMPFLGPTHRVGQQQAPALACARTTLAHGLSVGFAWRQRCLLDEPPSGSAGDGAAASERTHAVRHGRHERATPKDFRVAILLFLAASSDRRVGRSGRRALDTHAASAVPKIPAVRGPPRDGEGYIAAGPLADDCASDGGDAPDGGTGTRLRDCPDCRYDDASLGQPAASSGAVRGAGCENKAAGNLAQHRRRPLRAADSQRTVGRRGPLQAQALGCRVCHRQNPRLHSPTERCAELVDPRHGRALAL